MNVPRELFPLPLPFPDSSGNDFLDSSAACRAVRRRANASINWRFETTRSLNRMHGCSDFESTVFKPSVGQLKILERISDLVASAGPPSCTSAEAFHELCGARAGPGYDLVDAPRARYQPGLVSLPDEGGLTDGSACLRGAARDFWCRWQELLLAKEPASDDSVPEKPHSDSALIHSKWEYARFCSSLFSANLLEVGDYEEPTVGVFFVLKKDRSLRLILDTRCVNSLFVKPKHTHLPSPAAWAAVRTRADAPLYLAQMDVNNAFFRVRTPPELSKFFRLPPVDVDALRAVNPTAAQGISGRRATPRLCVLAMGWSWSLYFCQEMVSTATMSAGFVDSDMLLDKRESPNFRELELSTTKDKSSVDNQSQEVLSALERAGLACKGVELAGGQQEFTGLVIDSTSGTISVTPKRLWRDRLACLHALGLGRLTGKELQLLVAHFTWAGLMRRELLSLPHACYRFIEEAGESRWKLWNSARAELRMMCSLIVFASTDTRRPCSPVITATDASTGEDGADFGGFGVVQREVSVAEASRACRIAEGWRFLVEDAVAARRHALEAYGVAVTASALDGEKIDDTNSEEGLPIGGRIFEEIPLDLAGQQDDWQLRVRGAPSQARPVEPLPVDMAMPDGAPARKRRRQRRRAAHLESAHLCREQGAFFLEVSTVRGATADLYDTYLATFESWAGVGVREMMDGELDTSLLDYWEHLYFEGENHPTASKLLAALEYRYPQLRKGCPAAPTRARHALRGFRRLAPGRSRAPLPFVALMAMIGAALSQGLKDLGLALFICFIGYLRPSELIKLKGPQLVAPVAGSATRHWMLLLSPAEENVGSKTREFDESAALDWDIIEEIAPRLNELKRRAGQGNLWNFTQLQFAEHFRTLAELSGVSVLRPHPYCLRHGGASFDSLTKRRTPEQIKRRGRWKADASVSRYSKHARVANEATKLPLAVRRYGNIIHQDLAAFLWGVRLPPEPPTLPLQRALVPQL
ncbi:unnamed protein product [Prorocentrum cordatum]|uniref:Reverse transcriptase domain-containing protein n=1 Tax=Prorocentrum cordatum TaxID=2364126 RepID=A0ABN9WDX7_9DINO|nr:unnamed protein product [Polarella glacialis]